MSDDVRAILKASGFFRAVSGDAFERLVHMASVRRYERGEHIFRQDDPCPGIYVVSAGRVRIYKLNPAGKEHVLHLAGPGDTFAEVAVIGRFDCPASAQVDEDCTCALLPTGLFVRALESDHALCMQIMGGLTTWVRRLVGLLEDIALRDALSRVARYLRDAAAASPGAFALPSAKKNVANHLNLTSETFSRSLRRLTEMDVICSDLSGRLSVLDPEELERLAEGDLPLI